MTRGEVQYDLAGILSFYDRTMTPDYTEQMESGTATRDELIEHARQRSAQKTSSPGVIRSALSAGKRFGAKEV